MGCQGATKSFPTTGRYIQCFPRYLCDRLNPKFVGLSNPNVWLPNLPLDCACSSWPNYLLDLILSKHQFGSCVSQIHLMNANHLIQDFSWWKLIIASLRCHQPRVVGGNTPASIARFNDTGGKFHSPFITIHHHSSPLNWPLKTRKITIIQSPLIIMKSSWNPWFFHLNAQLFWNFEKCQMPPAYKLPIRICYNHDSPGFPFPPHNVLICSTVYVGYISHHSSWRNSSWFITMKHH